MTRALTWLWLRIALRSGRLFAPFAVAATLLAVIHSGGIGPARSTYATAAALLFPVQVWLAQQAVSAVPTETRRVMLVAVGSRRRMLVAVLMAAALPIVAMAAVSVVWPWLAGSVPFSVTTTGLQDLGFGVVATLTLVAPATVLGVISSEVSTGNRAQSAMVGAAAVFASLVLGFQSGLAWLVPPLVGLARLGGTTTPTATHLTLVLAQSWAWSLLVGLLAHRRLSPRW